MAMHVMNSAGEIAELLNPTETPDLKRDAEGKFISPEAPAPQTAEKDTPDADTKDLDDVPAWVARNKVTPELQKDVERLIQKAVGRKHAQAKDAEEFAAEQYNEKRLAEQRLQQLESELATLKANATPAKPVEDAKKPERSTFKSDEEYIEAVADWKTEQKFKEREEKAIAEREQARVQALQDAANARIAAARAAVPDFDDVVGGADVNVPPHIAAYMQESELFGELGYHFAKHQDDLKKLSDMPARTVTDLQRIGVALAKIEGKLQPFGKTAPVVKSKTPNGATPSDDDGDEPPATGRIPSPKPRAAAPVIQPLSSGSDNQVQKRESSMSYDEARASWEKRNRRNFENRKRH